MLNHYEILGISTEANLTEIKIAFRKLAKLYHPDKNTSGIEHFAKILKAYETLSNPTSKASYDFKLNYHQKYITDYTKASIKIFTFNEQELKRRQYYNDYIKKHEKKYEQQSTTKQNKTNYNEYKYILFATPLAVLLFLMVIMLATPNRNEVDKKKINTLTNNDSIKKTLNELQQYDKKN